MYCSNFLLSVIVMLECLSPSSETFILFSVHITLQQHNGDNGFDDHDDGGGDDDDGGGDDDSQ